MSDVPQNDQTPAQTEAGVQTNQKLHFHMACAELTFMDQTQQTGITRVNVLISTADGNITIPVLARAQQGAQIQLFSKLGGDPVNVLSCVFVGMAHLGKMTQTEFDGDAFAITEAASESVN